MPIPASPQELPQVAQIRKFEGMNVQSPRDAIGDEQAYWLENFAPLGPANARTVWGKGNNLYTAAKTIVYEFPFNLGTTNYHAVFYSDGTADQIRQSDGAVTAISAVANRFYNAGDLPHCAQWGSSGIVIVTNAVTNGYFLWDGVLYVPGDFAPSWIGDAEVVTTGNTNTNTTVNNIPSTTGMKAGMGVTGTNIPANTTVASVDSAVQITLNQAATGTTVSGTLNVGWTIPTGVKGNCVEIFQSRVWVGNSTQFSTSAPENGAVFATSEGGLTTKISDALKHSLINMRQANGFLYLIADSAVNVISNVQTGGSPTTTTFNNVNVDPQIGTPWRDSVQAFGRGLVFGNDGGIFSLYGGAVQRVSAAMDGIFQNRDSSLTPSAGVALIFNVKYYLLLVKAKDLVTKATRMYMIAWDGTKFFIGSQELDPTFISAAEANSIMTAWASDGTHLFPMFQLASSTLAKKIVTALWAGRTPLEIKQALRAFVQGFDNSGLGYDFTLTGDSEVDSITLSGGSNTITFNNSSGQAITFSSSNGAITFFSAASTLSTVNDNQSGNFLGLTLGSTSQDFTISLMAVGYQPTTMLG